MSNLAPIKDENRKTALAVIEFFKQFEEPPLPPYNELRLKHLGLQEHVRRYGFKAARKSIGRGHRIKGVGL
jgi:hypothetical protein